MDENRSLFNVLTTTRKMLAKRGYSVPDLEWTTTFPKFKAHITSKLAMKEASEDGEQTSKLLMLEYLAEREEDGDKVFVFFGRDAKLAVQDLVRHQMRLLDMSPKVTRALLITGSNPGGVLKNAILSLRPNVHIEVFTYSELLIDITEHEFVPQHTLLTEAEKLELLARYHVTETQLPRMTIDDPISRYFGLTYGQVVKIIRQSNAAGRAVTYRVVV
ncbi:hypothetical protein BASA81_008870 [Batrachochytrium salamandrivorans]|nr:hypothetical protein BASA81_008870 [Batrachochytrium salamandrivorans]